MDRAFFARLSEQSRYMRFMQHLAELTPRLVRQFTQIDDRREMALVALDDALGNQRIVGIARYVAETEGERAPNLPSSSPMRGRDTGLAAP